VRELLNGFVEWSPPPSPRTAVVVGAPSGATVAPKGAPTERTVRPEEESFSGFCFKIQANMDPRHRDRVAFVRICSGSYRKGMVLHSVRLGGPVRVSHALTFMAQERESVEQAFPGDIIGLHNYGTIAIGDTFSEGEALRYTGVPNFAPDLFRRVVLKDPLKAKQLNKGLDQLCEEGATQVYRPLTNNDIILGAVGQLQFEVTAFRLKDEYGVEAALEPVTVHCARWIGGEAAKLKEFQDKNDARLARDHYGDLVYLASSAVNLQMAQERFPDVRFLDTREHGSA
jgi:peptide chain release factor 3